MAATAAVSPSEYLQPAASTAQDSQPSPLALLAATCSKIGPPAVEAAVTPPAPPQPTPRKLVPIKPAPLPLGSGKNSFGILSSKGNLFQIQGSQVSTSYTGGQLVFAIQNPTVINKGARSSANIHYQAVPQIQTAGGQTIQVQPNLSNQIQIIPGTNQAILTPSSSSHKPVPIKPAPAQKGGASSAQVKLAGGSNVTLTLPVNNLVNAAEPGTQAQILAESPSKPGKKTRKKAMSPAQPATVAVAEQVETVLIETTAENIIQAGNNLLIVQSPGSGQPAVVQQVQVVQPKQESQVVQIPQQALRVVQAASATLPTVPQKSSQNFQIQTSEPTPTQVYFKTPSGELQTVLLQEAPAMTVAPSGTSCSSPVSRSSGTGVGGGSSSSSSSSSKKPATRKERPLPKIAPAGGIISLNAAQLAAAAQAMQTININGVQVQGVPVTITNTGAPVAAAGCCRLRERPERGAALRVPGPAAADCAERLRQQPDHQRPEPDPDPAPDGAGVVWRNPARGEEAADGVYLPQLQGWREKAGGPGEEETHLSHPRVRQDLPQDLSAAGSRPPAHGGAPLRLQLDPVREALHAQRRAAATRSHPHR
ncbi:PREDICTED: transcription factor Sp2 isoform X2 [Calidris pugnax]|uniref:transcription factor Sp2 isoform X2 n=1 Tax=Calidris pugnax TaxID=198806 RepID=UPI00071D653F|nr:PREDICTED: transcription factor Sp2 isoform X2 [Calidris pugnax]